MIRRSTHFLGISITDRAIACAELSNDQRAVKHVGSLALPADVTFDKPEAVGKLLAAFLHDNDFKASRAVVGVPAKWLIAIEKEVPPADTEAATAMLRLQAERLSIADNSNLVFDYAGQTDLSQSRRVLLVAMLADRIKQVETAMSAAGLSVAAVTSSALTLAACTQAKNLNTPILMLGRQNAEMVWRQEGTPRSLRHVSVPPSGSPDAPMIEPLALELRRAVAMAPSGSGGNELIIWDGIGLSAGDMEKLSDRLGFPVRGTDGFAMLGIKSGNGSPIAPAGDRAARREHFAAALALVLVGSRPELLPVNFKHSRLAVRKKRRFSNRTIWSAAIAAVVIIGIGLLYKDVHDSEATAAQLDGNLKTIQPQLKTARETIDRTTYGRSFVDQRPLLLDCLREITLEFRDDERVWVTSLSVRENVKTGQAAITDAKVELTAKAAELETFQKLLNRLGKNARFRDVRAGPWREGGQKSEGSFSITLNYVLKE